MNSAGPPTNPPEPNLWQTILYGEEAILLRHPDCAAVGPVVAALRGLGDTRIGEIVPSYGSILVLAAPGANRLEFIEPINQVLRSNWDQKKAVGNTFRIPCCYELGPDLECAAKELALSPDRLVELHGQIVYTVFAIGFQPGFPYAGWLPEEISGLARRASPRVRVEPGSVGITGRQTGIYPSASPGGWNLIGVTPCQLVDLEKGWFALKAGDKIRFVPVKEAEFNQLRKSHPEVEPDLFGQSP